MKKDKQKSLFADKLIDCVCVHASKLIISKFNKFVNNYVHTKTILHNRKDVCICYK